MNWKDLENMVKSSYDKLKIVYSRADKYEGDIAISSYKVHKAQFAELSNLKNHLIGEKHFDFQQTTGEELKEFW